MRLIIIDECIYSEKLMEKLEEEGLNIKYLGYGKKDDEIERYVKRYDTLLVTADTEFDTHFGWNQSLLINSNDSLQDKVQLIRAFAKG